MPGKVFLLTLEVPGKALGAILKDIKGEDWQRYPVTIEVPESDIGSIISSLVAEQIKLVSVAATGKLDERQKVTHGYVGGKRDKGITGRELVLEILNSESRIWASDQISSRFVKRGFAGGSWGPPMSELVKENKVRALGRGRYVMPGVTVKPGD